MTRAFQTAIFLTLTLILSGCTTTPTTPADPVVKTAELQKSPNDDRDYRYLELANELKVLLISDEKADKAAASLVVFRGSYDDPSDRPGLAHFLEHMLFIGTEKYPDPDGYFKYVKAHGGSSNAYTAAEHTNYFFDIQPSAFREGLDRFAQFFISPLFSKEYVEREKNAVNSEYQLQIKEDGWRGFAVQKVATNQNHPISVFNIGTLDTLAGDVHSALLTFFEENYSANQMSLVVLSNESLDEMQPWVTEMFVDIENRELSDVVRTEPMVLPEQIPATLRYDNLKNTYGVSYVFPTPEVQSLYKKKPLRYLGNLIGHEGDGSLHKLLKEKGWINALSAGDGVVDDNQAIMTVSIELTELGAAHIDDITGYVFAYIDMLKGRDIEAWLYDEQATVAELAFRFREKSSAINAVRFIAPEMEHYPAEELLIAPFLMEEFDAALIRRFLTYMNRDNVLMNISSPGYQGEHTEKWFGVSYDLTVGPIAMNDVSADAFVLPEPNPFLPESLELLTHDFSKPVATIDTDSTQIFLDTDVEFRVPRAVTHVSLRNQGGLMSLSDVARAQLYAALVQDDLNALAYPALLAGVNYQIVAPPKGFRVSVGGYEDKQLVLMDDMLTRLLNLEIDPERFEVLQREILKDLDNALKDRPYQQTYGHLQDSLLASSWTPLELRDETAGITLAGLNTWRDRVLSELDAQALLIGNVDESRATELQALLQRHLNLVDVAVQEPGVEEITGANLIGMDIDHNDASMVLFVQDDSEGFIDKAKTTLLNHLIGPGYFASLRTDQQLGYVVSSVNPQFRNRGGMGFVIQSPVAGPDELRSRTLNYVDSQVQFLADMTEEEFGANKGGLIARITQRDKNLSQRAGRYWSDLDRGVLTFDSRHQLAKAVSALTLDDMRSYLEEIRGKLQNQYIMIYNEGRFAAATAE